MDLIDNIDDMNNMHNMDDMDGADDEDNIDNIDNTDDTDDTDDTDGMNNTDGMDNMDGMDGIGDMNDTDDSDGMDNMDDTDDIEDKYGMDDMDDKDGKAGTVAIYRMNNDEVLRLAMLNALNDEKNYLVPVESRNLDLHHARIASNVLLRFKSNDPKSDLDMDEFFFSAMDVCETSISVYSFAENHCRILAIACEMCYRLGGGVNVQEIKENTHDMARY